MIRLGEQYDFVGFVVVDNVVVLALFLGDTRWFMECLVAGLDGRYMVGFTLSVAGMWWGFWWDECRAYGDDWWFWPVGEASDW
eukprot:scaffold16291_cov90-Attheya_sp.AAC.1